MLIATMYHRIGEGKHANSKEMLTEHLQYIKDNYPIVLPGDPLPRYQTAVCLTFDDATFDFYHAIFPLLQKLNIRALLAVPVQYIVEKTTLSPKERLSVSYTLSMQEEIYQTKVPFCTFEELREMCLSGHVEIASHSYSHANLTYPHLDLSQEIEKSKSILEKHLPQAISTFVYPFGRTSGSVHAKVKEFYPYAFRIGSHANFSWNSTQRPLSRIPADTLTTPEGPFHKRKKLKYFLKSFLS